MREIPTLFVRDGKHVIDQVTPGCEWVINGEGVATRKWDGTACLVRGGKLYKRIKWDVQKGGAPNGWLHWDFDPTIRSGHGWLPVGIGPEDWLHREAFAFGYDASGNTFQDHTYELCGPKINGNPERLDRHILIPHGREAICVAPLDYAGLREFLDSSDIEGVVWWKGDGKTFAKLKGRDFDHKRKSRSES